MKQHQVLSLVKGAETGAPRAFEAGVEPGQSRQELLARITALEEQVKKMQLEPQTEAVKSDPRLKVYGL